MQMRLEKLYGAFLRETVSVISSRLSRESAVRATEVLSGLGSLQFGIESIALPHQFCYVDVTTRNQDLRVIRL